MSDERRDKSLVVGKQAGWAPEVVNYVLRQHGEDDLLRRLREETQELGRAARMQCAPDQAMFMAWLARLLGARRAVEVGVFTGYSSLCVARALSGEDRKLVACDVSEEWTSVAKRYWEEAGVGEVVDLRLAPGAETLQALLDGGEAGSYDMAFVDADKTGYKTYLDLLLKLVRVGGVVVLDNTLWSGAVVDETDDSDDTKAIREVNDYIKALGESGRVSWTQTLIGDGVTLVTKVRDE